MAGPPLQGRSVVVVERDDGRAGRLIVALRGLGASAVRWSDDERGLSQARAARPDAVLVDAAATDWARPALATIAADPALGAATVLETDAATLWTGDDPSTDVLEKTVARVAPRGDRETKNLRAVAPPAIEPPKSAPAKVEVAPSIAARKIASARKTETYGAVARSSIEGGSRDSSAPPPTNVPIEAITGAKKPEGYVFPTKKAAAVEAESSSKATSLDLTVVPSSVVERAGLPDTDRYERAKPPASWVPWAIGVAVVLSALALVAAIVWG